VRDEQHFEQMLWDLLQRLHDEDDEPWAPEVSANPQDPHFAFSVGGTAFFIVGLHPQASREARRMPLPILVFNLHEQFEELRANGGFERMRDAIRRRDEQLQGSINPMVSDHGESSEARQYSGRELEDDWVAPFDPAPTAHAPRSTT
jgi:FPC/CPF motif-containing protein YcgG